MTKYYHLHISQDSSNIIQWIRESKGKIRLYII